MGLKGDEAEVRRAWRYLIATQQPDGSWKALSRQAMGNGPSLDVRPPQSHQRVEMFAILNDIRFGLSQVEFPVKKCTQRELAGLS